MDRVEWLIVGGGIHGVHIASRLLGDAGVAPSQLRIVDPGEHLLERWRTCTATTGMTHVRSPSVHNLDLDAWPLRHFAGKRKNRRLGLFAAPYDRPALSLFNDHCDQVIEAFGLVDLHVQARATSFAVDDDGVTVGLSTGGALAAQRVVLAIGASDQPEWPSWASKDDKRVHHIFAHGFDGWPASRTSVAVVGGGISAGQVALRLLDEGHDVHAISRHALRVHQFDSDPGWLGPKFMAGFRRERDLDRRRAMIAEARHRGSVPPDIHRALRGAIARGQLTWREAEIEGLESEQEGVVLCLASGEKVAAQRVLLATGFASQRPGGTLLDPLVDSDALPCARCGYPIVDSALRWHPRIHVSGPLAELELGPAARNIGGARRAGDRLMRAIEASHVRHVSCDEPKALGRALAAGRDAATST